MGEQLRIHGIEITRTVDPDLPQIKGEAHQLEQVWINLMSNARDALDEKELKVNSGELSLAEYRKTLTISVSHQKDLHTVCVTFTDNGMGMSEEQKKKIFEPFFTTKGVGKGTGLGLSISHGIIEKHNAKIEVDSQPGEHTAFIISFPTQESLS
jgi:signal transduction histidine kinase